MVVEWWSSDQPFQGSVVLTHHEGYSKHATLPQPTALVAAGAMAKPGVIALFDVDGTLTAPRKVNKEVSCLFFQVHTIAEELCNPLLSAEIHRGDADVLARAAQGRSGFPRQFTSTLPTVAKLKHVPCPLHCGKCST